MFMSLVTTLVAIVLILAFCLCLLRSLGLMYVARFASSLSYPSFASVLKMLAQVCSILPSRTYWWTLRDPRSAEGGVRTP